MKLCSKLFLAVLSISLMTSSLNASALRCLNERYTTLVPLRGVIEDLGADVNFNSNTQTITINYQGNTLSLKIGSKTASINGETVSLLAAPKVVNGTTYIPIRFISEALGGEVSCDGNTLEVSLDGYCKQWPIHYISSSSPSNNAFSNTSRTVYGIKVHCISINMNNRNVHAKVATAYDKLNRAASVKTISSGARASINGGYFAAYHGETPFPDGTIVSNGKLLHITDIGSMIGFTKDNRVLIDFVKTRIEGYINGSATWSSYRINCPTAQAEAITVYTPEYNQKIPIPSGYYGIVCIDGKINKIVTTPRTVPHNGFILVTKNTSSFNVGDSISYKTHYIPQNTSEDDWQNVFYALSAGPSLLINGTKTSNPANESFTEAKILRHAALRSFIGVTKSNQVIIGTAYCSVNELKNITKAMGLNSAMCLDGGASSGLYYNGRYLTKPTRSVNNCINFYYN